MVRTDAAGESRVELVGRECVDHEASWRPSASFGTVRGDTCEGVEGGAAAPVSAGGEPGSVSL